MENMRYKISKIWMTSTLLFLCALLTVANAQVKYCMNYTEFVNNQWRTAEHVSVGSKSAAMQRLIQSSNYTMNTDDEALEKLLNKKAFAVEIDNTLYVNCRTFRHQGVRFGAGYARAFRLGHDKLCVVNRKVGKSTLIEAGVVGSLSSFTPIVVSSITAAGLTEVQLANLVCYVVDSEAGSNGKTKVTQIGDQLMPELLGDQKALLEKYNAAGDKRARQSALNVLAVLHEAQLIK